MSYKDHLEAQKKYIQTKKEARLAKEEKDRNPRPPRLDPPPPKADPWLVAGFLALLLLPLVGFFFFVLPSTLPAGAEPLGLTVWIEGTDEEFLRIKNWLEPEILANGLDWTFERGLSRQDLMRDIAFATGPDLLIIGSDLAEELFLNQALTSCWDKGEAISWDNTFAPFWEPAPFQKTLGWAIPKAGQVDDARHLFTLMRQFAAPFNPF